MQETYFAAAKESGKIDKFATKKVEFRKVLPSILHTAGICQIDRWIGNALDTE